MQAHIFIYFLIHLVWSILIVNLDIHLKFDGAANYMDMDDAFKTPFHIMISQIYFCYFNLDKDAEP